MGRLKILIPEILGSQAAEAVASSEASATLADDNLLTPELWEKWRSASNDPADTWLYAGIQGAPEIRLNAVALAGLNMVPGNGEVMVAYLGDKTLPDPPWEEVLPDAVTASSGVTGAIGDVNEGSGATDGTYIEQTTAGVTGSVEFSFNTPTVDFPRTGARRQLFVLRVAASADTSGAAARYRPTVTVELREGSTTLATLGTKAIFGTTSHLLFFSWDAALLGTPDGSAVKLRATFGGGEVGSGVKGRIDSVWWNCESSQFTDCLGYMGESGWSTILPAATSGLLYDYQPQVLTPRTRWFTEYESIIDPILAYIFLREDHVPSEASDSVNRYLLRQPVNYVQAGRVCAGIWWSPAVNRAQGHFLTMTDPSDIVEDDDGGRFGNRAESYDDLRIVLDSLTETEMAWLRDRLREYGSIMPFYIELEPDSTFELGAGGWAKLLSNSIQISRRNTDVYKYSFEFSVRVLR